jgi:hypothetical protein
MIDVDALQASSDGFNFAYTVVESAGLFSLSGESPTFLDLTEEA